MNFSDAAALFAIQRLRMVEAQVRERGITDERVLAAMARVLRHEFTPQEFRSQAYADHPVPIGKGQTISQPYIVALMLEALAIKPTDKVLEIGAGSGTLTRRLRPPCPPRSTRSRRFHPTTCRSCFPRLPGPRTLPS